MSIVAGVDGCKAGWIVVLFNTSTRTMATKLCGCFHDVANLQPSPCMTALDMPIGLLTTASQGGRDCEKEARRLLDWPRRNSVFSSPCRNALEHNTFNTAYDANAPAGLTKQSFALFTKMRQVDASMNAQLQKRIREVHPEMCFYAANNNVAMEHRKKSNGGQRERMNVLNSAFGAFGFAFLPWWNSSVANAYHRNQVAIDDLLDACIAAWTAGRITINKAHHIPQIPPTDANGLTMQMWY